MIEDGQYREVFEDGVYFSMPETDYHAIPALSASGIKNLLISNPDFWFRSPFNPNRRDENTEAMTIGKAFAGELSLGDAHRECK